MRPPSRFKLQFNPCFSLITDFRFPTTPRGLSPGRTLIRQPCFSPFLDCSVFCAFQFRTCSVNTPFAFTRRQESSFSVCFSISRDRQATTRSSIAFDDASTGVAPPRRHQLHLSLDPLAALTGETSEDKSSVVGFAYTTPSCTLGLSDACSLVSIYLTLIISNSQRGPHVRITIT